MTCRYWVRSGQRTEPRGRAGGGRASLACRGRKLRPMPRRRAAQEEAKTMIQVRGRGVGGGAGFGTAETAATPCRAPAAAPVRSSPLGAARVVCDSGSAHLSPRWRGKPKRGFAERRLSRLPSPTGGFPAPSLNPAETRAPLGSGARTRKLAIVAAPVTSAEPTELGQQRVAFLRH